MIYSAVCDERNKVMIGIRTVCGENIGLGHIMRCMTIADAVKDSGEDVVFLLASEESAFVVKERGFRYCILESLVEKDEAEKEVEELSVLFEKHQIELLLIDAYNLPEKYFAMLRQRVKVAYIDDVRDNNYGMDILINYNIYASQMDYSYLPSETCKLLGLDYVPIRKAFSEIYCESKVRNDVLITIGGTGISNLVEMIAGCLLKHTECKLHIISGPFDVSRESIRRLSRENPRIVLHENVKEMWKIMDMCQVAVSAAGSTMYELACAGIPTVTFSFVDNQIKIAETFHQNKAALNAGAFHRLAEEGKADIFVQNVGGYVGQLLEDEELRNMMRRNAHNLVDGQGASRIARELIACKK